MIKLFKKWFRVFLSMLQSFKPDSVHQCFPEQVLPCAESDNPDSMVHLLSVYNGKDLVCIVEFDAICPGDIQTIRAIGFEVALNAGPNGVLFYTVFHSSIYS